MDTNSFIKRHIGPSEDQQNYMLEVIGVDTLNQLINETIPKDIRLKKTLNLCLNFIQIKIYLKY